jgi:sterol desaturase/sphingolipid hydroxylase (fatty acid hydroxylase superfamily)
MDDTLYGMRNKRGDWRPFASVQYPAVFVWPPQPLGMLRWLFTVDGYILPWNLFFVAVAAAVWFWLTPPMETMQHFAPGWIGFILVRNLALVLAFFGFFHVRLYVRKTQGNAFKYNGRWLDTDNPVFIRGNQTIDNMFWTLCVGVPVWTAYESVTMWAFATGTIPYLRWDTHPVLFVAIMLLVPLLRELHFYVIHRLLHWPPLYRMAHKLHHNSVNPGPWSGLAMHPVESIGYFSGVLLHWIIPSHPLHALFHLVHAGLSPVPGHTGFEKIAVGRDGLVNTHCLAHYLHHKYFECNYADGSIPLDRWFGTFHDGTDAAQEAMDKRFLARAAKQRKPA